VNEIVILLNRRRSLVNAKKNKLKDEFLKKQEDIASSNLEELLNDLNRYEDDQLKGLVLMLS